MLNQIIRALSAFFILILLLAVAWPLFLAGLLFIGFGWLWLLLKLKKNEAVIVKMKSDRQAVMLDDSNIIDVEVVEKEMHD